MAKSKLGTETKKSVNGATNIYIKKQLAVRIRERLNETIRE